MCQLVWQLARMAGSTSTHKHQSLILARQFQVAIDVYSGQYGTKLSLGIKASIDMAYAVQLYTWRRYIYVHRGSQTDSNCVLNTCKQMSN